jgi:hypothetical protein
VALGIFVPIKSEGGFLPVVVVDDQTGPGVAVRQRVRVGANVVVPRIAAVTSQRLTALPGRAAME